MPEITMGITKTARNPVFSLMREVRPMARSNAMTFTRSTVTIAKPKVKR